MDDITKRLRNAAYNTSIIKETSLREEIDEAAYIKLLVTENQIKMLIVVIENIDALSKQCLLELSDEEREHISDLYETAINCLSNQEESNKDKYKSQISYISRKRRQDDGSTNS